MIHANRFSRKKIELAGLATEVLGCGAQTARPELQIILYPGNPGTHIALDDTAVSKCRMRALGASS